MWWALLLLPANVHGHIDPRQRRLALMVTSMVIWSFYGWPMYYFATMVFAVHWLSTRLFDRTLALVTILPAVVTFVLVVAQIDRRDRDVVAAARGSAAVVRRTAEPLESSLIGHHGSLTSAEQRVPLLLAYG